MKITFVAIERFKSRECASLLAHYLKLLERFGEVELVELTLPRGAAGNAVAAQDQALLKWLEKRGSRPQLTILDERGSTFKSRDFATRVEKIRDGSHTEWIIAVGGAHGYGDTVRSKASLLWSLSPQTMAHELALVVAAEQVYRAFSILNGHPYHKES